MPHRVHELWYTPTIYVLYFVSAVGLGLSMIIAESTITALLYDHKPRLDLVKSLGRASSVVLVIYLIIRLIDLAARGNLSAVFAGTWRSNLFILEILVSVIIPVVLFNLPAVRKSVKGMFVTALLVVFGFIMNRQDIFVTMFRGEGEFYFPAIAEFGLSLGLVSGAVLVFFFFVEHFNLFPAEHEEGGEASPIKGAFSGAIQRQIGQFEVASGGTLFLDEVTELDHGSQAKLLAALEEKRIRRLGGAHPIEVDLRIIGASNRDLQQAVRADLFRKDLYYRLNVVRLELPPLRERRGDIPALARHLLTIACNEVGRRITAITPEAMAALQRYRWPGNVRELANAIERAVVFAPDPDPASAEPGGAIDIEHLPDEIASSAEDDLPPLAGSEEERQMILQALEQSGGNKREAARVLGWYPQKLYDRLRRHKITAASPSSQPDGQDS